MYLQSGKMWRKLMLAGSSGELNHHVFLSACLFDSLLAACLEVWEQQMVPLRRNESGRQGRWGVDYLTQRERARDRATAS